LVREPFFFSQVGTPIIRVSGFTSTSLAIFVLIITLSGGTALAQERAPAPDQPAQSPPSQLVSDLFRPMGRDMRGMLSRDNLFLAGAGSLGAAMSGRFDTQVTSYRWSENFGSAMKPGKHAGGFVVQAGGALATYAIGRVTDSPKIASIGASLFRAQVVSQAATQAIKIAVRRTRPDGTSLSLPSGHTAAAFTTASVLQSELGWKVGAAAYGAAAWVAASRVQARRHYLSDVIAGATIGMMAGRSVAVGNGKMKFALSPMPVPRGIGVSAVSLAMR
jgi:PAP2 superfamily